MNTISRPVKIGAIATLCVLLALNILVQASDSHEGVPGSYASRCLECGHKDFVDPGDIQKSNFIRMHPDRFAEVYAGERRPAPHHCAGCGVLHRNSSLVVCPRTEKRFILLDAGLPGRSAEQAPDLEALSPF